MSAFGDGAIRGGAEEGVRMAPASSRTTLRVDDLPEAVGLHADGTRTPAATEFGAPS